MKWLALLCMPLLLFSCSKNFPAEQNLNLGIPISFPDRLNSPFGVMIESIPYYYKVVAAKSPGVNYVQAEVTLNNYTQTLPYIDSLSGNGFKIFANFDYYSPASHAMTFENNTSALATNWSVLKTLQPYLVAVENEEVNETYHSSLYRIT